MPKDDRLRLKHMLEAAKEAITAAQGRTRDDLEKDRIWTLGIVKCAEIIGEAAARIDPKSRARHPDIPWAEIIAMRNRLVHVYFEVDLDQVWQAVTVDMPLLVKEIERALAREGA